MTEFEKGYEQGYKDGIAGAALPNVKDNGDKIDGYGYAYKTDSLGEPYIHIDSVRSMLKKAVDVKLGKWEHLVSRQSGAHYEVAARCSCCKEYVVTICGCEAMPFEFCPHCTADMSGGRDVK